MYHTTLITNKANIITAVLERFHYGRFLVESKAGKLMGLTSDNCEQCTADHTVAAS